MAVRLLHAVSCPGENAKAPFFWPFPSCTPSVWRWMTPDFQNKWILLILGPLQNCSLLARCSFVARPPKTKGDTNKVQPPPPLPLPPPSEASGVSMWRLHVDWSLGSHSKEQSLSESQMCLIIVGLKAEKKKITTPAGPPVLYRQCPDSILACQWRQEVYCSIFYYHFISLLLPF